MEIIPNVHTQEDFEGLAPIYENEYELMQQTGDKTLSLAKRLVNVMAEAGSVAKSGLNTFQNYKYVTESDIAKKMQALFVKHGIFVLANTVAHKATPFTNEKGKIQMFTQVDIEYTFINTDNPEDKLVARAYGEGMDTGDKAGYKASTGAHKYFLIRNFNLGSDEDAEKESPEITTQVQVPKKQFLDTPKANNGGFI